MLSYTSLRANVYVITSTQHSRESCAWAVIGWNNMLILKLF